MLNHIKSRIRKTKFLDIMWRQANGLMHNISILFPKRLYGMDLRPDKAELLKKRALLSYIVHPFGISEDNPRFYRHINIWRAPEIVTILNELEYLVDVVGYKDEKFVPTNNYDLFIGHGGFNFTKIAGKLPQNTIKIYFTTNCYWIFSNQQNSARCEALRERRGMKLPVDRFLNPGEEGALLVADGVIGIGSDFSRRTYEHFSPVIMFNNTALFDDYYEHHNKDFEKGKQHFLYFAGQGNVRKGLDLLLEAFVDLKQHLWICSSIDSKFMEVYFNELHNYSNIHLVGLIQPRSAKFYEIMDTCNYVILPSCSEGQPHSVIECMNQGLIPIVSPACNIDVEGYGMMLNTCTIEEIEKVVLKCAALSTSQCKVISAKTREAIRNSFSVNSFYNNMKNALLQLIITQKPLKSRRID